MAPSYPAPIRLSANDFARAGFFKAVRNVDDVESAAHPLEWQVSIAGVKFVLARDDEYGVARLSSLPPSTFVTEIALDALKVGLGRRWFFICACCQTPRSELFFDNEIIVCGNTFCSRQSKLSKRHRERLLFKAREQSSIIAPAFKTAKPPTALLNGPSQRADDEQPDGQRPPAARRATSTSLALDHGRAAGQFDLYFEYREHAASHWRTVGLDDHYTRPQSVDLLDEFPELVVGAILNCDVLMEGLQAQTLCWGPRSGFHQEVLFFFDWRDGPPIILLNRLSST